MNVLFLDRDGTILVEPPDQQVDSLEKLAFLPGVFEGLRLLVRAGFELVMVTNQDGLGTRSFPTPNFDRVQNTMLRMLEAEGIRFSAIFVCPHTPTDRCPCRKPKLGLVKEFLARNTIDLTRSFVLGDRETDVEFARAIGCRAVRLAHNAQSDADYVAAEFPSACRYILRSSRSARIERTTKETSISIAVWLDGAGLHTIQTGIGFFDHMLAQLSQHSLIDIEILTRGDLNVDEHHTIEDTGLALGEAIRLALGDKRGIERYGFLVPMDESLAQVALDLSGRPYFAFDGSFTRERIGDLPTELVEDFFRAFADGLRANLHLNVRGRNDHHKIEAMFKSVARALKHAVARDERAASILPSTKGTL